MTVKVYIWKPKFGSLLNLFIYEVLLRHLPKEFQNLTSVGHAAIEITKNNETVYISHRPLKNEQSLDESAFEHTKTVFPTNTSVLADANFITYEEDLKNRKKPDIIHEIPGLNELRMINYYNWEKQKGRFFDFYDPLTNNCCKVVVDLIKVGLNCSDKHCRYCQSTKFSQFQKYQFIQYHFVLINVWLTAVISMFFGLLIINIDQLNSALFYQELGILIGFLYCALLSSFEITMPRIWTPILLVSFIEEILKTMEDNKNVEGEFFFCK